MLTPEQLERHKAIIMARANLNVKDYYDEADPLLFEDVVGDYHFNMFPAYTVDELLVRPRCGILLCDAVRTATKYHELPDDTILRALINKRKRGT